jgi:hypothetical protein
VLAYSITTNTSFEAASKLRTQILRIKEDSQDVSDYYLFYSQQEQILIFFNFFLFFPQDPYNVSRKQTRFRG